VTLYRPRRGGPRGERPATAELQRRILSHLRQLNGAKASQLAEWLGTSHRAVNHALALLEHQGYVAKNGTIGRVGYTWSVIPGEVTDEPPGEAVV
jgi:predicted ArsR family transcriptional regulator